MMLLHPVSRVIRFALLVGTLTAGTAHAMSYGVFCFIGDALTFATRPDTTGTRITTTRTKSVPQPDAEYDQLCRGVLADAVKRSAPDAKVATLKLPKELDARLHAIDGAKASAAEITSQVKPLLDALADEAEPARAIVVTKSTRRHWSEPTSLAGLGYYSNAINLDSGGTGSVTNQLVRAYVAPYASLWVEMVDVKSGQVLHAKEVSAHREIEPDTSFQADSPWQALPGKQMAVELGRVMAEALQDTVTSWTSASGS